jgi:ABC-type transport system substrate-binding protein
VGFDVGRPPFDDVRVRQAFGMAVDRERLAAVACQGYYDPATGGFVPPAVPGHSPGIGLPYDPARARQLLVEAGYPGGAGFPVVDAIGFGEFESEKVVDCLQADWSENLGVEITWEIVDFAILVTRLTGEPPPPQIFLASWNSGVDPRDCLESLFQHTWGRGWQDPAYAELLRRAELAMDQGKRIELYRAADRILVQAAPVLPLIYGRQHGLLKPWVVKYPLTGEPFPHLKHIVIEPH